MSERMALKTAIDLMHVPAQVRLIRSEPLPDDVLTLLRIAAGDADAEIAASSSVGRTRDTVRRASAFFIEQILFAPESDSYRVLGADRQSAAGELRRNVALLLRWLHPDLDPQGERSIFVGRVTAAWNDLKTPERRAAYDESLRQSLERRKSRKKRQNGRWRGNGSEKPPVASRGHRMRARHQKWSSAGDPIGFFRRAFQVLFHRPMP